MCFFVCVLELVKPSWDDSDLVLLWWLSILVFYLPLNSYRGKCLLVFHSTKDQTTSRSCCGFKNVDKSWKWFWRKNQTSLLLWIRSATVTLLMRDYAEKCFQMHKSWTAFVIYKCIYLQLCFYCLLVLWISACMISMDMKLFAAAVYLYCLLCDEYPKSISWFPCMTPKAFYMISS